MHSKISLVRASGVRFISSSTACVTCSRFSMIMGPTLCGFFSYHQDSPATRISEGFVAPAFKRAPPIQPDARLKARAKTPGPWCHSLPGLFVRWRDARRFTDGVAVTVFFVRNAEEFRNFPARFQFKALRRTYPGLGVGLGVVHDDLHFQGVMIQPTVAFREAHLLAPRIPVGIHPGLIVHANRLDDKSVTVPLAHRVAQKIGVGIGGQRPPVRPDGAPKVVLLEKHEHPARNLNDLEWIRQNERFRDGLRLAVQGRVVLLARNGPWPDERG